MTRVGIEFTPSELRIAVLEGDSHPVVSGLGLVQLPDAVNPALPLKAYVKRSGLDGALTTFSVPSDQALFHWLRLPRAPLDELHALAQFRLRDAVTRSTDNLTLAVVPFEVVSEDQIDCLVIGAPQELVTQRAEQVAAAGLKPYACEVEAQALLRVAQRNFADVSSLFRQLSMTIVDFGRERTRFIVVQNRRIQFVRSVKFGSNRLVSSLAQTLGIPELEAQVVYDQSSTVLNGDLTLSVNLGGEVQNIDVSVPMESLFKELRRLITYFRTLRADRSYRGLMERLILSGEMVSTEGFSEVVGKTIGISIHELNPFHGACLALNGADISALAQTPHRFTVALGHAQSHYPVHADAQFTEENLPNGYIAAA